MLECVVNISEGRDQAVLDALVSSVDGSLIDLHSDPFHNRAVFTLAGSDVVGAAGALTTVAVDRLSLLAHKGVHPRLGVVDVVPFVPLGGAGMTPDGDLSEALMARESFCRWAAEELDLPCFVYGPERSLPEVRRDAFGSLTPEYGPHRPHPTAGACCVGARRMLVAYNLYLERADISLARRVAAAIRSDEVRALGLAVGDEVQVSCNLVAPWSVGAADVYDRVSDRAAIRRAELVGLIPAQALRSIPELRWKELGLEARMTIESRLGAIDQVTDR